MWCLCKYKPPKMIGDLVSGIRVKKYGPSRRLLFACYSSIRLQNALRPKCTLFFSLFAFWAKQIHSSRQFKLSKSMIAEPTHICLSQETKWTHVTSSIYKKLVPYMCFYCWIIWAIAISLDKPLQTPFCVLPPNIVTSYWLKWLFVALVAF